MHPPIGDEPTPRTGGVPEVIGSSTALRLIAFYLPQYHPIPENDAWWGPGFTEWTNVTRARPLFPGHEQPHLPADLGFYDLRLPEARAAQAELARAHGIHGFCYYHYWFGGRRLLERPFAEVLDSGEPDLPFCLCWANEPWSRRWLGEERDVLMPQDYSPEDDRRQAGWLLRAFDDDRYIRVADRPLLLIYRPLDLPEPRATFDRFREAAASSGRPEPWIVGIDAHGPGLDARAIGCDATLGFEPQLGVFGPGCFEDGPSWARLRRNLALGVPSPRLRLYDDAEARRRMAAIARPEGTLPCCYVSWDNSARRGRDGIIFVNGSPESFEVALGRAIDAAPTLDDGGRLVFINAWNEWAEGNHLEPDQRHGHAFLDAVRRAAFGRGRAPGARPPADRLLPAAVPPDPRE